MKRISQRDMLQSEIARLTVELNGQKAEVERLRLMVKSITGGLDEAIEAVHCLEAELALLRKVAEVARRVMDAVMAQPQDVVERNIALAWLDAALAELDKEGKR